MSNYKEKLQPITTMIFDFDGVLTDGKVLVINENEQLRSANVKDGYALQYAVKSGYRVCVISGGKSVSMSQRLASLGIKDVFLGVDKKIDVFRKYVNDNNLDKSEILYMGDDIPDYEIMNNVGVACCPADAAIEIKSISDYISDMKGGEGCVRDIIEQVMRLHDKWFKDDAFHW
jgi:3-deoxy-D-manno-octulosonate 8-phosphate phosphatase (KDO 8-P phosphatase)